MITDDERPTFKLPPGYEDEAEFLSEMRKYFSDDMLSDQTNRDAASEDLAFVIGEQWTPEVKAKRDAAQKPTLTVNRLQAFVAQVLGSRKMNETDISFSPDNGGTKQIAQLREDLTRSIQKQSVAKIAFDTALQGAVVCGMGNFKLELEYQSDDVFEQRISIEQIADHLAVVWDSGMTDPTGADATRCFVILSMPQNEFRALYPWATPADLMSNIPGLQSLWAQGWYGVETVRVVEYWHMRTERRTLALMQNGAVQDITDVTDPAVMAQIQLRSDGTPYTRKVNRPYAERYVCSATDILDGPYRLPINRIPVFRVPGWEFVIGLRRFRNGLVRFLKDPQRIHNFSRSVHMEKLQQNPRAAWVASDQAIQGREQLWRNAHRSDDPLLIWNQDSGIPPHRAEPMQLEPALIQLSEMSSQDIKDVSNIHEANLGMPSNEVSGVAIQRRQAVSDVGTIIYHDNLTLAIEQCGRVVDQLINVVYDTPRTLLVMGKDGEEYAAEINGQSPTAVNIVEGKYSVTARTGPSYTTRRIEQAENMLGMATAMPQMFQVAADLIVEAQDWPDSDRIAARLRASLPPSILAPDELTQQQQQAMQQQQQAQQAQAQVALQDAQSKIAVQETTAQLNSARAEHFRTETELLPIDRQTEAVRAAADAAEKEIKAHVAVASIKGPGS